MNISRSRILSVNALAISFFSAAFFVIILVIKYTHYIQHGKPSARICIVPHRADFFVIKKRIEISSFMVQWP